MKVYVILKGEYSDRHICAVATDERIAKLLEQRFTDDYFNAYIEEFETDIFVDIVDKGYKAYYCRETSEGIIADKSELSDFLESRGEILKTSTGAHYAEILARDAAHARKIFTDKLAEYKAREAGIT